ncbi:RNA pseudouridine synthase [Empedobacter sp.]|uniref:RluA family pseudouridine synthase n=1 Tax=Empedobacter sp. TaxID=1927715 RepID=UPI0028AE980A|nr:RNA pseudouridine synthase [Empedobacter sp.]
MNPEILFEDNHLLIINKKAGELAQGDETGDIPLIDSLKDYIKERDNKPGNVFLGLVHRLDRPTSGVLIFAKTSKALTRMNEMFQKRNIVQSKPPKDFERLEHYLKKNPKNNKTTVYSKPTADAKKAILEYTYLGALDSFHCVEVKLFTGRSHQIRAQLSSVGSPIKGDLKYGAKRSNPDGSICLHAHRITFEHPVKKEEMTIVAPVPKDAIWQATNKFNS